MIGRPVLCDEVLGVYVEHSKGGLLVWVELEDSSLPIEEVTLKSLCDILNLPSAELPLRILNLVE